MRMKTMLRFRKILRSKKSLKMTLALRAAAMGVIVMAFVVTAVKMFSHDASPVVSAKGADAKVERAAMVTTAADADPLELPKAGAPRRDSRCPRPPEQRPR